MDSTMTHMHAHGGAQDLHIWACVRATQGTYQSHCWKAIARHAEICDHVACTHHQCACHSCALGLSADCTCQHLHTTGQQLQSRRRHCTPRSALPRWRAVSIGTSSHTARSPSNAQSGHRLSTQYMSARRAREQLRDAPKALDHARTVTPSMSCGRP